MVVEDEIPSNLLQVEAVNKVETQCKEIVHGQLKEIEKLYTTVILECRKNILYKYV